MAIKLNGVEITSNKLNDNNVLEEKLNGTIVYSYSVGLTMAQWQYVTYYSSEQNNEDLFISLNTNGYQQGLIHLNNYYPAGDYYEGFVAVIYDLATSTYIEYVVVVLELEFYEISEEDYNLKEWRLNVTVPEGYNENDVIDAFKTQHPQYYDTINTDIAVMANDGNGISYWGIRPI